MIIMAFEPNNNQLKEALRQNPEAKIEQPSVHAKIRQIAKKQGYKSASRFLNDLFKDMEV